MGHVEILEVFFPEAEVDIPRRGDLAGRFDIASCTVMLESYIRDGEFRV